MRQITELEERVLYLIDYTEENCRILSLKYKYNFEFYKNRISNTIIWLSKKTSFPIIYRIDSDNHYSSPFDYMHIFVDRSTFHSKRRIYIRDDLKFYDSKRAARIKKHKSRTLKDTK